ncbi:hypothetical protein L596_013612 [Steinernema carpocapsae]|uniref:Uncharacterized protein n=1 Tax=Steinernema carpocapsae TaxID=34508 RepID=A0A4U5P0N4_STECR|nr:hypothetical protein L596_013612 [Steinernema carpocapsae]
MTSLSEANLSLTDALGSYAKDKHIRDPFEHDLKPSITLPMVSLTTCIGTQTDPDLDPVVQLEAISENWKNLFLALRTREEKIHTFIFKKHLETLRRMDHVLVENADMKLRKLKLSRDPGEESKARDTVSSESENAVVSRSAVGKIFKQKVASLLGQEAQEGSMATVTHAKFCRNISSNAKRPSSQDRPLPQATMAEDNLQGATVTQTASQHTVFHAEPPRELIKDSEKPEVLKSCPLEQTSQDLPLGQGARITNCLAEATVTQAQPSESLSCESKKNEASNQERPSVKNIEAPKPKKIRGRGTALYHSKNDIRTNEVPYLSQMKPKRPKPKDTVISRRSTWTVRPEDSKRESKDSVYEDLDAPNDGVDSETITVARKIAKLRSADDSKAQKPLKPKESDSKGSFAFQVKPDTRPMASSTPKLTPKRSYDAKIIKWDDTDSDDSDSELLRTPKDTLEDVSEYKEDSDERSVNKLKTKTSSFPDILVYGIAKAQKHVNQVDIKPIEPVPSLKFSDDLNASKPLRNESENVIEDTDGSDENLINKPKSPESFKQFEASSSSESTAYANLPGTKNSKAPERENLAESNLQEAKNAVFRQVRISKVNPELWNAKKTSTNSINKWDGSESDDSDWESSEPLKNVPKEVGEDKNDTDEGVIIGLEPKCFYANILGAGHSKVVEPEKLAENNLEDRKIESDAAPRRVRICKVNSKLWKAKKTLTVQINKWDSSGSDESDL